MRWPLAKPAPQSPLAARLASAVLACAGLLLLAAFMSMMPSMAVVDGHPAMAPPPDGSLCNELRPKAAAAP